MDILKKWGCTGNNTMLAEIMQTGDDMGMEIRKLRARVLELEKERDAAREEVERLKANHATHTLHLGELWEKDAEAWRQCKQELREITDAIDDPGVNLTITAAQGVTKLHKIIAAQQLVIQQYAAAIKYVQQATCLAADANQNSPIGKLYAEISKCENLQPSTEALDAYVAEAVKKEREANASLCETTEIPIDIDVWMGTKKALTAATAIGLAAAIRARSDKENGEC